MQSSPAVKPALSGTADPSLSVVRLARFRLFQFWIIALFLLFLTLVVAGILATTDPNTRAAVSGLGQTLTMLIATSLSWWVSSRVPAGRLRWAWRSIAFAQALYLIANVLLIVSPPSPTSLTAASYANVFIFLSFYIFLALGVFLLPSVETTAARQVRLLLDVAIVVGALLGPSLVFLIVPRYLSANPLDFVYIGYPFADLLLLLVAAVQVIRGIQQDYRPAFFWLMLGMLCLVYADTTFNIVTLPAFTQGAGPSFGIPWIDPLWVAGLGAFCLAPLSLLVQGDEQEQWRWLNRMAAQLGRIRPARSITQFLVLGAPVLVLFGLVVFTELAPEYRAEAVPVTVLTLLVVGCIIARQLLTMRDLVDAREATERAQQLDSLKEQFITSVNHELRTPLMTLHGYLALLMEPEIQRVPHSKRADMLARAHRASVFLTQLVQSILDTRNVEQEAGDFTPEAVPLREVAEVALSLIPAESIAEGQLSIQLPEVMVWGDAVRIQQILTNLVSNAIKYSPPGTPITVSARVTAGKTASLLRKQRSDALARQVIEIRVRDHGLGIPPEQQDLLFRRFVRLPRDIASHVRGNGLGLYLCRVYAQAMDGAIWVESSGVEGEGSTFYLRLPLAPVQRAP